MRAKLRYWKRLIRALATDPRIPDWMRAMILVSLAIKTVPVPDFGIDEVLLAIVAILLLTRYRPLLRQLQQEAAA